MSSSITKSVLAVAVLAVGLTVPLGTVGHASATPSTSTPPVAVTSRPSVHVARGADGRVALVTPAAGTTTGAPRTLTGGTTRRKSAVTVARGHVDDLAGTLGVDPSDLAFSRTGDTAPLEPRYVDVRQRRGALQLRGG